jgi:hypothetical protein
MRSRPLRLERFATIDETGALDLASRDGDDLVPNFVAIPLR